MKNLILAPSLLAADFTRLGEEISDAEKGGAQYLHLDVMDGAFVPSISFGMPLIKSLRKQSDLVFDVHLMIEEPLRYIRAFADAGADIVSFHAEADRHIDRTLNEIKSCGMKAAVAINPATQPETLEYILPLCDMVLLMSVNPGFGGQKYIPYSTEKIRRLAAIREKTGLDFDIEVDGGVNTGNVREIIEAGANVIVAGSAVFGKDTAACARSFIDIFDTYK
ncbi:MAG: ribulose-phosphate 3-epimerase [Lachnospiraceae bacterium]|nr:ribulose-phosphate 3-epimerase [Lachnospiraceae bacterium]MBR6271882.1 ribulose-phosphate 3-epimerase [Lachnospiraceae bacterium]